MSEEKTSRRSRVTAEVPAEKKILPASELNKIHAEQFKSPKKTEQYQVNIQTSSGALKTKHFEVRTYPNGAKKQRVVKVVKHK